MRHRLDLALRFKEEAVAYRSLPPDVRKLADQAYEVTARIKINRLHETSWLRRPKPVRGLSLESGTAP